MAFIGGNITLFRSDMGSGLVICILNVYTGTATELSPITIFIL